jgi:hypothetical protein
VSCGSGFRFRSVECKIFLEFSRTIASLPDQECPGLKPTTTELCEGNKCSSSATLAKSIGVEKPERKNASTSSVNDDLDSDSINSIEWPQVSKGSPKEYSDDKKRTALERDSYEWRTNGFTPCSASCLGGQS